MSKETKLKTVKKWQEEFSFGFEWDLREDFATALQCNEVGRHMLEMSVVTMTLGFNKFENV